MFLSSDWIFCGVAVEVELLCLDLCFSYGFVHTLAICRWSSTMAAPSLPASSAGSRLRQLALLLTEGYNRDGDRNVEAMLQELTDKHENVDAMLQKAKDKHAVCGERCGIGEELSDLKDLGENLIKVVEVIS